METMQKSLPSQLLKEYFGYDCFRGLQACIIEEVIAGRDVLVLMPTGGGKSLCYQIPALALDGCAIVVSPLISLMEDQVAALTSVGIRAAYYNSSLEGDESKKVLARLHRGNLQLLYIAPERLVSPAFLERLGECKISLFAIDEAHCISQWGHDFRPEYAALGQIKHHFPTTPLLALTATADKQTRVDIVQKLQYKPTSYIASFNRPNIHYSVLSKTTPLKQLEQFLQKQQSQAGIVYCGTRDRVDKIALHLQQHGRKAASYHAGLSHQKRREVQSLFRYDKIDIVVATIAFGMGIDKPNVRFVVHYDLPKSIEGYYQETGRAGRDGLPAQALLLYNPGDIPRLRSFIAQVEDKEVVRIENNKLNHMIAFAQATMCRRQILLRYFGEEESVCCDYCDICNHPPSTIDVTEDAQKFLSCIYRLNQSYGMFYVIDVLCGKAHEKILQARHNTLSTYGLGKNKSLHFWRQLAWHLILSEFCYQDMHRYNILRLTSKAKALLKGEIKLTMAYSEEKVEHKIARKSKQNVLLKQDPLFEALRKCRRALAEEENKPPFMVFSDATLEDIAIKQPTTLEAFLEILGVGKYKSERYGEAFLQVVRDSILK